MQSQLVLPGSRISKRDELLYSVATGLAQYKLFTFTFTLSMLDMSNHDIYGICLRVLITSACARCGLCRMEPTSPAHFGIIAGRQLYCLGPEEE